MYNPPKEFRVNFFGTAVSNTFTCFTSVGKIAAEHTLKSFERVARKYGIDFALKKDTSSQPPRYLVFFKSKDADVLTAAFREYSGKVVKNQSKEKPSIRKQLSQLQEVVKEMAKSLSRNKHQEVDR